MRVLLSIKPKFAWQIFHGSKRFEYRKSLFAREVTHVVVYASSPVRMVIGEFEIEQIIKDDLDKLWRDTEEFSGITRDYFTEYFSDKESGYAIKIRNAVRYPDPIPLAEIYPSCPPQSFAYLPG